MDLIECNTTKIISFKQTGNDLQSLYHKTSSSKGELLNLYINKYLDGTKPGRGDSSSIWDIVVLSWRF